MAYAPILTESQLERVRVFTKSRQVAAGVVLYNPNDDTPPVYVVIEGKIRIVSLAGGVEDTVTTYGAGQFSGELLMIAGRRSIYRCQAVEASRLLELSAENLRTGNVWRWFMANPEARAALVRAGFSAAKARRKAA